VKLEPILIKLAILEDSRQEYSRHGVLRSDAVYIS
jgi:hypothetical protein